ncbi:MAG: DNA-directed RNA polymerase subunit omega [Alphaproteobacteria bacterium]
MARVTVEDCVIKVPNRFELVLLASQRARDLSAGATPTLEREADKNPVIALREIAEESVELETLRQSLVSGLQKHVEIDEPEDDSMAILAAAEKEWAGVAGEIQREAESMGETSEGPGAEEAEVAVDEGDDGDVDDMPLVAEETAEEDVEADIETDKE